MGYITVVQGHRASTQSSPGLQDAKRKTEAYTDGVGETSCPENSFHSVAQKCLVEGMCHLCLK